MTIIRLTIKILVAFAIIEILKQTGVSYDPWTFAAGICVGAFFGFIDRQPWSPA